jgi:hypothetical protein
MWNKVGAAWRAPFGRVLILIALGIVASDLILRAIETRLSGNLAHVAEIPALIDSAAATARPTLLLLGNSLTYNGIAPEALRAVHAQGPVTKITPDGTNYWDWQCILEHQVLERDDLKVDMLVLGYAWHLLSDQTNPEPSSLGALFCRATDVFAPRSLGLDSIGDIAEFLLAGSLRPYALRETLRNRGLALVIPDYARLTQLANVNVEAAKQASGPKRLFTYAHFTGLAEKLHARGTTIVIIAMPVRSEYDIDEELKALDARGLIVLLDYRATPGIDAHAFKDEMHLTEAGQTILTARLSSDLRARAVAAR